MHIPLTTLHLKALILWTSVLVFRLMPLRAPNVEPLLAVLMPVSTRIGMIASFTFGFTSIAVYDFLTAGIGMWTLVAGIAYGMLGVGASIYMRYAKETRIGFVSFAIVGTLAYDVATGMVAGPVLFEQSFSTALAGQIPFTILHLLGAVLFAVVLSPLLSRWLNSSSVFSFSVAPQQLESVR